MPKLTVEGAGEFAIPRANVSSWRSKMKRTLISFMLAVGMPVARLVASSS